MEKRILKSQQGELDAVLVYQALANQTKDARSKEVFLRLAADEGKHGSVLRSISQTNLKPSGFKAGFVSLLYRCIGQNVALNVLIKGELRAIPVYEQMELAYPQVRELKEDERKHADLLTSLKTK